MTEANERRRRLCYEPVASLATRKREYWLEVRATLGKLALFAVLALVLCVAGVKWMNADRITLPASG